MYLHVYTCTMYMRKRSKVHMYSSLLKLIVHRTTFVHEIRADSTNRKSIQPTIQGTSIHACT